MRISWFWLHFMVSKSWLILYVTTREEDKNSIICSKFKQIERLRGLVSSPHLTCKVLLVMKMYILNIYI